MIRFAAQSKNSTDIDITSEAVLELETVILTVGIGVIWKYG